MSVIRVPALSVILLCATPAAHAGSFLFGVGNSINVNDPFIKSFIGPEISGEFRPNKHLGFSLNASFRPDFGTQKWTALTTSLINTHKVSPDLSFPVWDARLGVRAMPFHAKVGKRGTANVGFVAGIGVIHTQDDLLALQCENDPQCVDTEKQTHLSTFYGVSGEITWGAVGFRFRADRIRYIETIASTTLETKKAQYVALEFVVVTQ